VSVVVQAVVVVVALVSVGMAGRHEVVARDAQRAGAGAAVGSAVAVAAVLVVAVVAVVLAVAVAVAVALV
jgi:hypothetical protein